MNRQHIIFIGLLLYLLGGAVAFAIPAYPGKRVVKQVDGTTITLVGHGNEYNNYLTDEEGYRVQRDADGIYRRVTDGRTGVLLPRYSAPAQRPQASNLQRRAIKGQMAMGSAEKPFRGLVLLVDFKDRSFRQNDAKTQEFYQAMVGQKGFTGYDDPFYGRIACPGSLRDYFCDNSYGRFDPEFDVVGPIHLDVSQYFPNMVDNAFPLLEMVLEEADKTVDFSKYDSDGDGDVDMFYVIFAGYSSQYSGNDERLLWPFAATMIDEPGEDPDIICDGVRLARFACSTEIYGWSSDRDKYAEGIGVMAHEFAHILGFVDHYDTSSGYQEHPNTWDLMSAGSYNGLLNNCPCALNAYEKYEAGFLTPRDISELDGEKITLRSTETSEDACMIHSLQEHVTYFMENRQMDKWDTGLEHHGMLVWRIDSVVPEYWTQNYVNVTTRACMRLVRADGTKGSFLTGVLDEASDPFPGSANVTLLDNNALRAANLLSYDMYACPVWLDSIREQERQISFVVKTDYAAEPRPVTYEVLPAMKVTAERLVDGVWMPTSWTMRSGTAIKNGEEQKVLYNLLPNDVGIQNDKLDYSKGVFVAYSTSADGTSITVNAQRLALDAEKGIWFCNLSDVETGGAGALQLSMNPYGLLSMPSDVTLGYRAQTTSAYMISASKFLADLCQYRNFQFEEIEQASGIEEITNFAHSSNKCMVDGRVHLSSHGHIYNMYGQITK